MSYTQLLYHIVIRTKYSQKTLSIEHSEKLYRYMWGIIKNKNSTLYRLNGVEDHIHLLVSLHPTIALSNFVRDLKSESSRMLKQCQGFESFVAWSSGYAALTYSLKEKNNIIEYIKNQRLHHKHVAFRDEYIAMIEEMGLKLDPRDWEK